MSWNGRPSYSVGPSTHGETISALTFTTTLCIIFFTVLLNGGVWIHSSHVQSNGTGIASPKMISKIWNTFIMLAMLVTGLAAWGVGMTQRDTTLGSMSSLSRLSWSNVLQHDRTTRIVYIVHECIVVAASLSVTVEVLREYSTTNKNGHGVSLPLLRQATCTDICAVARAQQLGSVRHCRMPAHLAPRHLHHLRHRPPL